MAFDMIIFLCIVLPLTLILYWIVPQKGKNLFLLVVSLFFYAWSEPKNVLLILGVTLWIYFVGRSMELVSIRNLSLSTNKRILQLLLGVGIVGNCFVLIYFKYLHFIVETFAKIARKEVSLSAMILPVGISIFTFQGISYLVDVYRSILLMKQDTSASSLVQKNFISLSLYMCFFPQILAGPIMKYKDMNRMLSSRETTMEDITYGIERFIIGLSKKAILANILSELGAKIFATDVSYMGIGIAWLGALVYSLEIFLDFSGYSDMAIGIARIFGFRLMENFNAPYMATSIKEFWRRWHISLSTWFRDYLYIPLGGNRKGNVYVHLLIVFIVTGLWHGAAWGFVLWGLWHGLFLILERLYDNYAPAFMRKTKVFWGIKWLYTIFVVMIGWVMFYLVDLSDTIQYMKVMLGIHNGDYIAYDLRFFMTNKNIFVVFISLLVCLPWTTICSKMKSCLHLDENHSKAEVFLRIAKRASLLILLLISMVVIVNSSYRPFIYLQF